jgi:uncharacterized membrane protein
MRWAISLVIAAMLLATVPAWAQSQAQPQAPAAPTPESSASLAHSALKATTFKVGSSATNLLVLSAATGSAVAGAGLTVFMLGASWVVYTANDYIWDVYYPPPVKQAGESFDASADAWRNTGKFLTFKPVIASIKLASLYAVTGSALITATFGTASILTNTVVFYANNMAWDFYDWYAATPAAGAAGGTKVAATR